MATSMFSLDLGQLRLAHGPSGLIGQALLKAYQLSLERGVKLRFGTYGEVLATYQDPANGWKTLLPCYDVRYSTLSPTHAFCVIGENDAGEIVATSGARLYEWESTSLADEMTSLRMFYDDPAPAEAGGERWTVGCAKASGIRGRVVFAGVGWYRPDFRGRRLFDIVPRFQRAYSLATWAPDYITAIQVTALAAKGSITKSGYPNIEPGITAVGSPAGNFDAVLGWITPLELLADLERFVVSFPDEEGNQAAGTLRASI